MIVERIVDGDEFVERGRHAGLGRAIEGREGEFFFQRHIGHQCCLTAGAAHGDEVVARDRAAMMQKFQRLDEGRDGRHARNAVAPEKRIIERVGAGEG